MQVHQSESYVARGGAVRRVGEYLQRAARWIYIAAALLLLVPALSASAQFESASVLGYVKDTSGAAIANSTITLTNTATAIAQTAKTDSEGRYEFASVPIGTYTVKAERGQFRAHADRAVHAADRCSSTG